MRRASGADSWPSLRLGGRGRGARRLRTVTRDSRNDGGMGRRERRADEFGRRRKLCRLRRRSEMGCRRERADRAVVLGAAVVVLVCRRLWRHRPHGRRHVAWPIHGANHERRARSAIGIGHPACGQQGAQQHRGERGMDSGEAGDVSHCTLAAAFRRGLVLSRKCATRGCEIGFIVSGKHAATPTWQIVSKPDQRPEGGAG